MLLIGQERGWVGTKSVGWGTGRLVTACHPPLCLAGRPTQYVIDSLTSTRPHLPTTMSIVLPFVSSDTPLIHVLLNLRPDHAYQIKEVSDLKKENTILPLSKGLQTIYKYACNISKYPQSSI